MKRPRIAELAFLITTTVTAGAQSSYYLDCTAGNDSADGRKPLSAWRTVAQASAHEFQPGDSLLLRRGSRCDGMLWPKGSSTAAAPIRIDAYGRGALPVIIGGAQSAGLRLHNQQGWEIANLEVAGGSPYGIHIGGDIPVLHYFRLTNLVVRDVSGEPATKDSGLVVIAPDQKAKTLINDVIVDGVTAYHTTQWAGITVNGASFDASDPGARGERVEVRNSIVHDVGGDGIFLGSVAHGVLEHNAAWNTGLQETETIGTPDAIWEWMCRDCRVAYNEGYFTDSPGVDGGVFDIDYGNEDNRVEHNFGHDSQGYCVSIFGAEGASGNSVRSVIRDNVCIHNARSPRLAKRQGAIYLSTWHGGHLNGFSIENNIVLWEPPLDAPAFQSTAQFTGNLPNRFVGNTILAVSGSFVSALPGIELAGNHYCVPSGKAVPVDSREATESSASTESLCKCLREWPPNLSPLPASSPDGSWTLRAKLATTGLQAAVSRSALVVLKSMQNQFASRGLHVEVALPHTMNDAEIENWRASSSIDASISISAEPDAPSAADPELQLIAPSGTVDADWRYPIEPSAVWLRLQGRLGTPAGMLSMPACSATAAP